MIKILKRIWDGPWTVKASFIFLAFVFLCLFFADPGRVTFTALFVLASFRLISWLADDE